MLSFILYHIPYISNLLGLFHFLSTREFVAEVWGSCSPQYCDVDIDIQIGGHVVIGVGVGVGFGVRVGVGVGVDIDVEETKS